MSFAAELFHIDALAVTVGLCIVFFTVLTVIYSVAYMRAGSGRIQYYAYLLLTLVSALGVAAANNLVLLLACWGLTGLWLYLLIGYGERKTTAATARKTLIFIGGSDAFMMLGVALIFKLGGSFDMQQIRLDFTQPPAMAAFVCLLIGVLSKAGAVPLHTWLVDTARDAPAPVTAFLPAALDKLLGIYLLARMVLDLFAMTAAMNTVLLAFGAATIVGAGMMMLSQRDFRRLLGYCAVSQVGYILIGLGSAHPLGIAGALFHMVNHAIYKSCLFFAGGVVERKTGAADLDRLGALAGRLPLVFGCFLLAALAVAGIPPLNGFASKWMIYQGIIEAGAAGRSDWIVWLAAAMFGSVLTLAAMMKLVHAIFLGQPSRPPHPSPLPLGGRGDKEDMAFTIPIVALAALCVVFGIAAYALPLKYLILPILDQELAYSGIWQPTLATVLILVAIGFGFLLYGLAHLAETLRRTDVFIGGETLDAVPGMRVSGTAFYNTIEELPLLGALYHPARRRRWDLYRLGARAVALAYRGLAGLHDGILSTYLAWCLLATGLLFIVLLLE